MAMLAWIFVLASFVGWVWTIVLCFQEGETLWGIGSIIIPFVAPIYAIMNFGEAKVPFFLMAGGFVGQIVCGLLGGAA